MKTYIPSFEWSPLDEQTYALFDNGKQVFCFDQEALTIRNARLKPEGYPLLEGPQARFASSWPTSWGSHGTMTHVKLKELEADTPSPERFTMRVISDGKSSIGKSDWRLTVTYDVKRGCYVYDVDTTLKINKVASDVVPDYTPWTQYQYYDLYTSGMADPKVLPYPLDPEDRRFDQPLWNWFVYEEEEYYAVSRRWLKVPLNRFILRNSCNMRLKRDGKIGLFASKVGNPVIQLLGDTATVSLLGQCNMLYDLHFRHVISRCQDAPPMGTVINAQFRIFDESLENANAIIDQAVLAPILDDERAAKLYPRYEEVGINSFANPVSLEQPDHSRVWRPFHHDLTSGGSEKAIVEMDIQEWNQDEIACIWDHNEGCSDNHSLRVATTVDAVAGWQLVYFDCLTLEPGRRYKLSCRVKTEDLCGHGAAIGYALPSDSGYIAMDKKDLKPRLSSSISGSNDWTEISVITPPIMEVKTWALNGKWTSRKLQVILWHDGKGTSWFDDFLIEEWE